MGILNPLGPLFSSVVNLRNWLYESHWLETHRVSVPVFSVGNITMGGTGKTPFIHWLIEELQKLNKKPGVISRSYGASLGSSEWVISGPEAPLRFGDEAVLLKQKNPLVPILSGPQKWQSALRMDQESQEIDVILVDDGFQHRRLQRNLDIVLLDCSVEPSDYSWPPEGRARESLESLKRADVVVFTRWEQRRTQTLSYLEAIKRDGLLVLQAEQVIGDPVIFRGSVKEPKRLWQEGVGLAFCGLGNPESFYRSLDAKGLHIKESLTYRDHTGYGVEKIAELISRAEKFDYLITSEKDSVKLANWPFHGPALYVTPMQLKVSGAVEAFREKLTDSLRSNS